MGYLSERALFKLPLLYMSIASRISKAAMQRLQMGVKVPSFEETYSLFTGNRSRSVFNYYYQSSIKPQ